MVTCGAVLYLRVGISRDSGVTSKWTLTTLMDELTEMVTPNAIISAVGPNGGRGATSVRET